MSDLLKDLRFTLRTLLNAPAFTVVALLTLGLGIGANAAIFTVIKGILLEPLSYPDPDRLVVVMASNPEGGFPRFSTSPPDFYDFRARSKTFEALAAYAGQSVNLTAAGQQPERLNAVQATADYFRVLSSPPLHGRVFTADEDVPDATRVVVLNHGFWQRRLGADPAILGQDLTLNGEPHTVIGIMPPEFAPRRDLFVPLAMDFSEQNRGAHFLAVIGRLAAGQTLQQAQTEMEGIAAQLEQAYPNSNTGWTVTLEPMHALIVEDVRTALWILSGAVLLVLLIACANVANLLLARLALRQREVALRAALGASRRQLVSQFLTESLVLALGGGLLGLLVAVWGTRSLMSVYADELPRASNIGVDASVLVFTLSLALTTGLIFGLIPALRASRPDLNEALKEGGGRAQSSGLRSQRLRTALVLTQVAISLVLLIGAGLLIRSFARILEVDPGFSTERALTLMLELPESQYPDEESQIRFYRQLFERTAELTGVAHVGGSFPMPLTGSGFVLTFNGEGWPIPEPNKSPFANIRVASPHYFEAMGIPLHRGREFTFADGPEAPLVAVVNRSAAAKYWPDQDPIGQRITFGNAQADDAEWLEIVGVVGDVHHEALSVATDPEIYWPVLQSPLSSMALVARSSGSNPLLLASPLRQAISEIDPNLPIFQLQTLDELVKSSVAQPRFNALLLGLFAGLALLLAAIGLYGLVNYTVTQQMQEIGIRVALGASRGHILNRVLRSGMLPVVVGLSVGLVIAFLSGRLLQSLIYGISATDLPTFVFVLTLLLVVAALACTLPAWRATRIDPMHVLREE